MGTPPDQLGVRPVVVATFFSQLTSYLAESSGAERSHYGTLGGRDQELYVADGGVCIATLPFGAPATVSTMEVMIACGAKTFLVVGAAGSLQPDLPIGSVILPTTAIREEGTSHHYLPPEAPAAATAGLVDALRGAWRRDDLEPRAGLHWTTDAPYREHKEKIAAYRQRGVLAVDMEVSALYAVAQHRGVGCAAILAISDELYEPWRIGFRTGEFQRAIAGAGLAALAAA